MSPLEHMKQYKKSEDVYKQVLASAIRIGLVEDTEEAREAHQAGWNAAIVHLSMNNLLKDEYDNTY